jgi:hypothetical protein
LAAFCASLPAIVGDSYHTFAAGWRLLAVGNQNGYSNPKKREEKPRVAARSPAKAPQIASYCAGCHLNRLKCEFEAVGG